MTDDLDHVKPELEAAKADYYPEVGEWTAGGALARVT